MGSVFLNYAECHDLLYGRLKSLEPYSLFCCHISLLKTKEYRLMLLRNIGR